MKHTTEELLLAIHIRELANNLRKADEPTDTSPETLERWLQEHPLQEYVIEAMAEITLIAETIDSLSETDLHPVRQAALPG